MSEDENPDENPDEKTEVPEANQKAKKESPGLKWTTLKHNGIHFPPEYEPLPKNIMVKYDGKPVKLDKKDTDNPFNLTAEECAMFYANKLEQDIRLGEKNKSRHLAKNDKKYNENFWTDWKKVLGNHTIKDLKKVDFTPLINYIVENKENKTKAKKAMSKEEKAEEKERKEKVKDMYGYAEVDDMKFPVGAYIVQPPGLYAGHGEHPLRGCIKKRIAPSDIIINVSKKYAPKCFIHGKPCTWKEIVENHNVEWIANWIHPLTKEHSYVYLKREASHYVTASDKEKFEKARKLGENIEKIRKQYTKDLSSPDNETKQLSTAVYLLDKIAIRPGTEKDEAKESNTLGLTTLKCNNISFGENNRITIDFAGKSSIQFNKKFKVDEKAYKNLEKLCSGGQTKQIFPSVNATSLNKYLKTLLPDLTAKNFRTWKASSILQQELDKNIPDQFEPTHEKKMVYDKANINVALALNHKKLGGNEGRAEKIEAKIEEYKEKLKKATTDKQKASVNKSISLQQSKLDEVVNNVATSTSKLNYIDPRIVISWAKKAEMPIEKIYNKQSLKKFGWAMDTELTWKFL